MQAAPPNSPPRLAAGRRSSISRGGSRTSVVRYVLSYALVAPFFLLYVVLVLLPAAGLFLKSFTSNNDLQLELMQPSRWAELNPSLNQYVTFFVDSRNQRMLLITLMISILAVIISTLVAIPIAYLVTRREFRHRALLRWILSVPFYVPSVVAAYALLVFFGPYGMFNVVLERLLNTRLQLVFTIPAVIVGTTYIIIPISIRVITSAFESIRVDLAEASFSLGGAQFYTFRKILLPLALPSILASVILAFTIAIGLVVIALIVGGGSIRAPYLPVEILLRSTSFGYDIPLASAMSVVLLVLSLVGQLIVMRLLGGRREWL
jgi:ABC-type spermidine/putrescine transport system permease subunit I